MTVTPFETTYRTDVGRCARCGKDHAQLEFRPLANAPDEWTHWAMCPETNEPVLVRMRVFHYSPGLELPVYHKCGGMPTDHWDIFCGPGDYPDEWNPGQWRLEMNEYHAVIKFCPYCGAELKAPEDVAP